MISVMTEFFFHECTNLDHLVLDKCGVRSEDELKELHNQFEILTRLVILDWTFFMNFKEVTLKVSTPKLGYFVMKGHTANVVFLESILSLQGLYIVSLTCSHTQD